MADLPYISAGADVTATVTYVDQLEGGNEQTYQGEVETYGSWLHLIDQDRWISSAKVENIDLH